MENKGHLKAEHANCRDWEWGGIRDSTRDYKKLKVSAFDNLKKQKRRKLNQDSETFVLRLNIQGHSLLTKLVRKGQGFGDKTKTQLPKLG